jgi:uncharacterized protein (DUF2267 family)
VTLVQEATGLDDFAQALAALEAVVGGIVRRLPPDEASDFMAQLPSELRERLLALPPGPDRGLTLETIAVEIAKRLDVDVAVASTLAHRVGTALRYLVSPGELAHVKAQLPEALRPLLNDEILHRTP